MAYWSRDIEDNAKDDSRDDNRRDDDNKSRDKDDDDTERYRGTTKEIQSPQPGVEWIRACYREAPSRLGSGRCYWINPVYVQV